MITLICAIVFRWGENTIWWSTIGGSFFILITLIYIVATIVLLFMLLWGAFDWLTSEGDKEKVENARRKIINAIVGIMLFAIAFAIIQVIGQFTCFKFFAGQK